MNIDLDFLILNLVLLAIFSIAGLNISNKKDYWHNALPCILFYTFVLGSRYMRGNDYEHYCEVYLYNEEEEQRLFTFLNDFLKTIGVGAHYFYYYYSAFFITCAMLFLEKFKTYAKFLFPTFLLAFINFDEFMIRQALSFSFVFLYLRELWAIKIKDRIIKTVRTPQNTTSRNTSNTIRKIKVVIKKRKYIDYIKDLYKEYNVRHIILCIVFASATISIHVANILVLFLITSLYFIFKKPISCYISIPLLIIVAFVFNKIFDLSYLNPVLNLAAGQSEKIDSYVENGNAWFEEEAMNDQYTRNPIVLVFELLGNASLFYYGEMVIKRLKRFRRINVTLFNTYVFGTLFLVSFRNLEILNRIGTVFQLFWCFPITLVIFYAPILKLNSIQKIGLCFLVFWIYDYLKMLLMRPEMTLFIWDSPYF